MGIIYAKALLMIFLNYWMILLQSLRIQAHKSSFYLQTFDLNMSNPRATLVNMTILEYTESMIPKMDQKQQCNSCSHSKIYYYSH